MKEPAKPRIPKRAITLGGGGPAAGLHIGVLKALRDANITFDVWSLSCIGAWVGIVYNQCDKGKEVEQTYEFFRNGVFRDDESYERFPINTVFGPDWFSTTRSLMEFASKRETYDNLWLPHRMMDAFKESMSMLYDHLPDRERGFKKWDEGDINKWVLNQVMAPNPFVRYLTSMMYLSNVTGLSRINYPNSDFMKSIKFERLFGDEKPWIFHNAWNLDEQTLAFFSNYSMKDSGYRGDVSASTLCACSALPFIEETVKIDGNTYCEGALVDTVNFRSLLEEHPDLDEIWVSRIVDVKQIRKPENLHDAMANLCQLFAATVGEDDVKLFKYHVQYPQPGEQPWKGTVVEIQVPATIDFKWNHSNLDRGRRLGEAAAEKAIGAYHAAGENKTEKVRFINERQAEDGKKRSSRRGAK
ncbi:patatin-like phospholipase family protein [Tardiphaga sp.]|uniref:patatin-like phospholipase family protein n=1 Tax=Tardiphaga sp. TaxID=1926292 RepID=UPI002635A0EB|nr:patatin-like phospholipase family protein [Tardiphaga sp.]MDB5616347.1 alpha/beta hydrolase [Tardiphaga sp.]